jgi:hypothetical protein
MATVFSLEADIFIFYEDSWLIALEKVLVNKWIYLTAYFCTSSKLLRFKKFGTFPASFG